MQMGATPPVTTPPAGPSAPGPVAAEGMRSQARVKLGQAARLIAEAVGSMKDDLNTEEGKGALAALRALAPLTPETASGLGESEIMSMLSGLQSAKPSGPSMPGTPMGFPRPQPRTIAGPPMMTGR